MRLEEGDLHLLAESLPFERLVTLLDQMDYDDEADVIGRLPEDERVLR